MVKHILGTPSDPITVEIHHNSITFYNREGVEIVSWAQNEVEVEPDVAFSIANAVAQASQMGATAFAQTFGVRS